ncbi:MAG: DinB family protein [Bacteroidota bacterium]
MKRQPWTAHVFNLDIDPGWADNILSRLKGTEIKLRHYCQHIPNEQLIHKPNESWSIKEHIGHLIDLEPLHEKRLHEFASLKTELSAADMSNLATEKAHHNLRPLEDLIIDFAQGRTSFIKEYHSLPEQSLYHMATHPRLKVGMKPVDLLFFVAEHDDHHLTTILERINAQ